MVSSHDTFPEKENIAQKYQYSFKTWNNHFKCYTSAQQITQPEDASHGQSTHANDLLVQVIIRIPALTKRDIIGENQFFLAHKRVSDNIFSRQENRFPSKRLLWASLQRNYGKILITSAIAIKKKSYRINTRKFEKINEFFVYAVSIPVNAHKWPSRSSDY